MKAKFDDSRTPHIIQFVGYNPATEEESESDPCGPALVLPTPDGEQDGTLLTPYSTGVIPTDLGTIHYILSTNDGATFAHVGFVAQDTAVSENCPVFTIRYNNEAKTDFTLVAPTDSSSWNPPATMATTYSIANVHGIEGSPVYLLKNGHPVEPWHEVREAHHDGFSKQHRAPNTTLFTTVGLNEGDPVVRLLVIRKADGSELILSEEAVRRQAGIK